MIISDKIYIDCSQEPLNESILAHLTYKNPEYYAKMNMGLPVRHIPKEIKSYTYDKETRVLAIPRGEAIKLRPFIGNFQYNFSHPEFPENLQYINNDFELDEYQTGAIKAMTVDGYRQGIIHAVTSAGKSHMILKTIVDLKQRGLVVVHRKLLMKQLLEDIDKYIRDEKGNKIKVGIIGDGKLSVGPITIALDKTLAKNLNRFRSEFGVAILDECHICPANTIFELLNSLNTKFRFGFSGTLKRKDQKDFLIYSTFGTVIYTISKDQLLDKERIVPVEVEVVETETRFNWDQVVEGLTEAGHKNPTTKARELQNKTIANDPTRNALILRYVSKLKGKTIVLSNFVAPCYLHQERLLQEFGISSGVITGKDSKEAAESFEAMKHGDLQTIFATVGCVSTGISISDLDHIVLISPIYTNEALLHQIRGRLMRMAAGKTKGTLHFFWDKHIFGEFKLNQMLRIMRK